MRTFAMLFVAGLVALCVGAAHAETKEPIYGVLRTPKGYLVVWNESKAHFKVELPGKELRRAEIEGWPFLSTSISFRSWSPIFLTLPQVRSHPRRLSISTCSTS